MSSTTLTHRQKAAVLLMSLPPEVSAQLFKELGPQEVHDITMEISKLPQIPAQVKADVVEEFLRQTRNETAPVSSATHHEVTHYGNNNHSDHHSGRPLAFLKSVGATELLHLLDREHAQTIAVVLSHLGAQQAGRVLGGLRPELQSDVACRMAELGEVSADVVHSLENILRDRLSGQGYSDELSGKDMLLGILEHSDPEVRERFLTTGLKAKLCDFEDLEGLDEMALHQVLRLINWSDLEAAMQGASLPLVERVARFLTPDNAQAVRRAVEGNSYTKDEVIGARRQICNILRGLVSLGKVHLSRR